MVEATAAAAALLSVAFRERNLMHRGENGPDCCQLAILNAKALYKSLLFVGQHLN